MNGVEIIRCAGVLEVNSVKIIRCPRLVLEVNGVKVILCAGVLEVNDEKIIRSVNDAPVDTMSLGSSTLYFAGLPNSVMNHR